MSIITPTNVTTSPLRPTRRTHRRLVWTRRVLLGLVVALVALGSVGAIYQAVATEIDSRTYPPPGQLVAVGGHRLHLHCVGTGSPTVILETTSDGTSANWAWVQPELARTTRVCAYDRAGHGWSEPGPEPRDAQRIAHELRTLLDNAGVAGPYVLVGHSAGGLFVRMFAAEYPETVAGIVLIDTAHPDDPDVQAALPSSRQMFATTSALAPFGVTRLVYRFVDLAPSLPARQQAEIQAFWSTARHHASHGVELAAREATDAQVRAAGRLGDTPLMVISAGQNSPTGLAYQADLATLSANSVHRIMDSATHLSLTLQQEDAGATSAAIRQVVEAVRGGVPLAR